MNLSIIYTDENAAYRELSDTACHDLGLDVLVKTLTADPKEQRMIMQVISRMTPSRKDCGYRAEVFEDLLRLSSLREKMTGLFEQLEYFRNQAPVYPGSDRELGIWRLFKRLDELDNYIKCVESMKKCLEEEDIRSEGLKRLREHISALYDEAFFTQMKEDIDSLKIKASEVQSVTLGVNVNQRFEAVSVGLVSVNSKPFKKSGILSHFADAISSKNRIKNDTAADSSMTFDPIEDGAAAEITRFLEKQASAMSLRYMPHADSPAAETMLGTAGDDGTKQATFYLETAVNRVLSSLVKKLRDVLSRYANVAIVDISRFVPEFVFYIRFCEFTEGMMEKGHSFCRPRLSEKSGVLMDAKGFYNLKLAVSSENPSSIVPNSLTFSEDERVYILTGANRGGKTTVTQAVGLLYVLAQAGVYVPAEDFSYVPADSIYTHFPADEDKTMDLGRLGEECVRFRDIYSECTADSLVLLNETFSTTSFEEGAYIARDAVKALLKKHSRVIYNTHMHRLGAECGEICRECGEEGAVSLRVKNEGGKRSFELEKAPPEGMSYARDIAEKYGVTYELLVGAV